MVARCLPVFKVSASLITPPPDHSVSPHMCFIFPRLSLSPPPPPLLFCLPLSLFSFFGQSVTQLHFLRGLCTVWGPD